MSGRSLSRRSLAGFVILTALLLNGVADGNTTAVPCGPACCQPTCNTFRVRPQDAIWAISTRQLGGCSQAFAPYVWKYVAGQWQPSTLQAFYAEDSADVVTSVYIHGNRIEAGQALSDGLNVYFQLIGRYDGERPTRFVIWSWPSSQIKGVLKDVRSKAARTDIDAYYLAQWLSGMRSDVQVGLLGYSFGARIITGGLHLLGGGQLCGRTILGGNRQPTQVVLWAAALHNHWLLPGHYHGCALPMASRWLIYINSCDPVLQRYHMLEKHGNPAALGYTGLAGLYSLPPQLRERIEQWQVSHLVGRNHDMQYYLYSPVIAHRTKELLLWYASPLPGGASARPVANHSPKPQESHATKQKDRKEQPELPAAA